MKFIRSFVVVILSLPCFVAHADPPELVQAPSTELLSVPGVKGQFIFNPGNAGGMSTGAIDVEWAGTGIDPSKITSTWVTSIAGFPLPFVSYFEVEYAGGWPTGVTVTYTLNPGNSGVIQNTDGEALPETTGTFLTPGTPGGGGGPCDGGSTGDSISTISLVKFINYVQIVDAAPVIDPEEGASVQAAVVAGLEHQGETPTGAILRKPDGDTEELTEITVDIPDLGGLTAQNFEIPPINIPSTFFLSTAEPPMVEFPTFLTEEELDQAYPNGNYSMLVNVSTGSTKTVSLPFDPSPDVPVPTVVNLTDLQSFDVSQPITVQWEAFAGASQDSAITLTILERNGSQIFNAPDPCDEIELVATDRGITIPAGTFQDGVTYDGELSFLRTTHTGENTVQGFREFANLTRTTSFVMGAPAGTGGASHASITGIAIQESGGVLIDVEGELASSNELAVVQVTRDLGDPDGWQDVSAFVQLLLNAGPQQAFDIIPSTASVPYSFYRVIIR